MIATFAVSEAEMLAEVTGELEQRIARKAGKFPQTDSGNGELFASLQRGRYRFDHRRGLWVTFHSSYWQPDQDEGIIRSAIAAARIRYQRASLIDDLKQREVEARWAIASESRQKIDATVKLARSEEGIADTGKDWNTDPMLLAVANGVIDLHTGDLRDGRPN